MFGRNADAVRKGRVIYNDGLDKATPPKVKEIVNLVLETGATGIEVWLSLDNPKDTFGVQVLDDGMYLTAFFDLKTGNLNGDWF